MGYDMCLPPIYYHDKAKTGLVKACLLTQPSSSPCIC